MDIETARTAYAHLRTSEGRGSTAGLDDIWAALTPVRPEQTLGADGQHYYFLLERAS